MKILIVTHYFTPHVGGIEIVAYNQAKGLVKLGNEVTVLTTGSKDEKEHEVIDGIKVFRTKAFNLFESKLGIPYPLVYPTFIARLSKEIKRNDIIHIHGHVYTTSFWASFLAKKYKKQVILTQHSTYVFHKNPILRFLESLFDKTLGKYSLNSSNLVIAVSDKTAEYAMSIIKSKKNIKTLYNGVDINRFKPAANKSNIRKELGLNNQFICFSVRRITFKNGIDNLLTIATQVADKKNILFLLGGKGPDLESVKAYILKNKLKNIKLLGYIKDDSLPKYYAASDLFILPSQEGEGFPLVVLEAFSAGIPVIATKSGGHVEIIKNGQTGYLTDVNKPEQISQKVALLSRKPKENEKMSVNCRNLIQERFSWESNVQQLLSQYKLVNLI